MAISAGISKKRLAILLFFRSLLPFFAKGAPDPQLLDLLPERVAIDPEEAGCTHLVALGLFEHQRDKRLFNAMENHGIDIARLQPPHAVHQVRKLLFKEMLEREMGAVTGLEDLRRQRVGEYLISL